MKLDSGALGSQQATFDDCLEIGVKIFDGQPEEAFPTSDFWDETEIDRDI